MAVVLEKVAVSLLAGGSRVSVLALVLSAFLYLNATTARQARKCSMHEIELYHKNADGTETFYKCVPCPKCPYGQGGSVACGERYQNSTRIECDNCVMGKTYSDDHGRGMCKTCTDCGNKRVLRECSLREKRICSDECIRGYHYKTVTAKCEICVPCCRVGKNYTRKNIYPPECKDMTRDRKCEKTHFTTICPHMTFPSTASPTLPPTPTTTLNTTPTPKILTSNTTRPSLINDANIEHKGNDSRTTKEDSLAESSWAIKLYAVVALFALAIMLYCIFQKLRRNRIVSNNSSTSSIPDEVDESEKKGDVKIEMERLDSPERTGSRSANQAGARKKMTKCFLKKQVSPLPKVALYTYSQLDTADQEQFNTTVFKDPEQPTHHEKQRALIQQSEELKSQIPDGHLLSNLPGRLVLDVSMMLDTPSSLSGWREVGLTLGVNMDRLDYLKRENLRPDGSPTTEMLKNVNAEFPETLTKTFVEALHSAKRYDVAKTICSWKWQQEGGGDSRVSD